jgi:V8-like Glu-specific endopeptidase
MSEEELVEESLEEEEELEVVEGHQSVWSSPETEIGTEEVSPEDEELEVDLVQEDYIGEAEEEKVEAEEEAGVEENPEEVEGYDSPEVAEQEAAEAAIAEESEKAYHEAGEGELIMERVLGRDDRSQIRNTRASPWRTICSLQIEAADGRRYIGTGNFIGPHTVMTAGHCVYMHRHGGWVRRVRVIPGANGRSNWPFGSAIATRFVTVGGWVRRRSPNYDYGAVKLNSDTLGRRVGWMGFAALRWLSLIRLRVNNSGYPADKPYKTQWWNFNRIVLVSARRIFYLLDTYGGQSGSPVWRYRRGHRHQVAIHAYGGRSSNSGTRITRSVFDNMLRWRR